MISTPSPLKKYKTIEEYQGFKNRMMKGFKENSNNKEYLANAVTFQRVLCQTDLFFLLWYGCNRGDMFHQWILDRCKEVESDPNGCLDLWARNHYKSTIITFGKTMQDILASHGSTPLKEWKRESTFGIFSAKSSISTPFLIQIKDEFEKNDYLKQLFSDILYKNPRTESPRWSSEGLIVKRKSNPKECTVEAYGLIDAMPTGKHFLVMVYDDLINENLVTNPEIMKKVEDRYSNSSNLSTKGGLKRIIGTRYHHRDIYHKIITDQVAKLRLHTATKNGNIDGEPVFLTKEELETKKREQGEYIFNAQMMQDPTANSIQGFKEEWLRFYGGWRPDLIGNIYILVDPANSKKKSSDYTVMAVIALCDDQNYYLVDLVRDRLNLKKRCEILFSLVAKYQPIVVGYEEYGMVSDIDYIKEKQDNVNYHFSILKIGGKVKKEERIKKLQPTFENQKFFIPKVIEKMNYENVKQNLVDIFINEEYLNFPMSKHDDILDALARIYDVNAIFPIQGEEEEYYEDDFNETTNSTGY